MKLRQSEVAVFGASKLFISELMVLYQYTLDMRADILIIQHINKFDFAAIDKMQFEEAHVHVSQRFLTLLGRRTFPYWFL